MKIICSRKPRRFVRASASQNHRIMSASPFESKRNADRPYMYFTKHGIGPGTLPKDVNLVNWEDLDDYMTVIYVDRPLSTKELDHYDIIPETRNTTLMKKYGIAASISTKRKFTVKASKNAVYSDYDYKGTSYYGLDYKGVEDSIETDDYSELESFAWEKLMNGCTVKLTNEESGEYVRLSPAMCEGNAVSIDDFVEVNRNKGKTVADVLTQFPDYCKNVKSSADSKRKFTVKGSSESYSMEDYDIVIYRNSEKVYSGSVYDVSFYHTIKTLCKDSENLRVFKDWLLDYVENEPTDADVPKLVVDIITCKWEEVAEVDEDFSVEISMYGNQHSDIRFVVSYAKDEVVASVSAKRKFTVNAASETVNKYELQTFAENLIKELESEYHCKLSTDAFLGIIDMITDGSYFEGAHEHGSTPEYILEDLIYDVFEEDTGIVVGSVQTKKKNAVKASSISAADNTVSQDDVDELVLYIVNDGNLYRQIAKPIIKNMKRKRENGDYNDNLAVKGWLHLAKEGVRRYDKEFGSGKGSLRFLNEATRNAIAEELKEYYEDEVSYDDSIVSSTVTANADTNKNDRDYLITLADAVVMEMDAEYGDVVNLTYDISDSAITFSIDSEVVYIQPIDQISPNWDDLTADTEELYGCVWSAVMPNF
ncbi:MAG: hypothetical protein NC320_03145 [Clostridium sp.]|nr:hypothetical protein [Clostridium sp.]